MIKKYKMSSMEKSIYAVEISQDSSIVYNIPLVFKVNSAVDYCKLQNAFQELCSKHDILRTSFGIYKDKFAQFVADSVDFQLSFMESEDDIETIVRNFVKPFTLDKAPLLKAILVKKSDNQYYIIIDIHHIIYDGGSYSKLIGDLTQIYNNQGLEDLGLQYKDFSVWHNKKQFEKEKTYWLNKMVDLPHDLELICDYVRPAQKSYRGDVVSSQIGTENVERVISFCKELGITEYMFYVSAYLYLLSMYSNQNDVIIGTPLSGRTNSDTLNMLGMFVNTIPLRVGIDDNITLKEYMLSVKEEVLNLFDNQEYPFEKLVDDLKIDRNSYRNPLFEHIFVLQNSEKPSYKLGETTLEWVDIRSNIAPFDLTLNMELVNGEYQVKWEYNIDIFSKKMITRLSSHYNALILNFLDNLEGTLKEITCLEKNEFEMLLGINNQITYDSNQTFVDLFEQQVIRTPKNYAVVYNEETLTYYELHLISNFYANYIHEKGIEKGDVVAIVTERNIEMFIAMISILKAGAVYVPIDPKLPEERVKYMLEDSNSKLIFRGTRQNTDIDVLGIEVVDIDRNNFSNNQSYSFYKPKSEDLAYIIYTSGTTGTPKGVLVKHKGLWNLCNWYSEYFELESNSCVVQQFSYIFDGAVSEIYPGLTRGASIHIATDDIKNNPASFLEFCQKKMLITVPSLFKVLIEYVESHNLEDKLKQIESISLAGEATTNDIVKDFYSLVGDSQVKFTNLYGPTEDTVCSTYYPIENKNYNIVPIGKAISNKKSYIFNKNKLCGIGIPGELCVSGIGVARGYLNRLDLTNEKFIKNPYNESEVVYRTGDLVRWNEDGEIEYLGRIDDQVKIHGYRIELLEIKKQLLNHKDIVDAAVIVKGNGESKYICGYYVSNMNINVNDIYDDLGKVLPEYMLPSHIVELTSIPVTKTGKLDKRALPTPVVENNQEIVLPTTEKENLITKIMQNTLDLKQIGITENFFAIGGDSIKAIRISSKLKEFGVNISVRNIMERKTIQKMAEIAEYKNMDMCEDKEVYGDVKNTQILLEFSSAKLKNPSHFNQSVLLEGSVECDIDILKKVLDKIWNYHDALRSKYINEHIYIYPSEESEKYDFYEYQIDDDVKIINEIILKIESSFDLSKGPLFKVSVLSTPKKWYLFIVAHHLVIDGISWRILLDDINYLYGAFINGENGNLPAKTHSFKHWADYLYKLAENKKLQEEKKYWDEVVGNIEGTSNKEVVSKGSLREVFAELNNKETLKLKTRINSKYGTDIKDILVVALVNTLYEFKKSNRVTFLMEAHGREPYSNEVVLDRTVGWFTSLYPVKIKKDDIDLESTIISVKEELKRIPNNGLGFGLLELKGLAKSVSDIEVTFNYLGEFIEEVSENMFFKQSKIEYNCDNDERNIFGTPLLFNCLIKDNCFGMSIFYDDEHFSNNIAELLLKQYMNNLQQVIDHCIEKEEVIKTPSDLGEYSLPLNEFKELVRTIECNNLHIERIYPLSPMQEGMLFHKITNEGSGEYVEQTVINLGQLKDPSIIYRSIEKLCTKHEVLRTMIFYLGISEPRQLITDSNPEIDCCENNITQQELEDYLKEDADKGFDFGINNLIRFAIRKVNGEFKLIISFHHIIIDGWCLPVLLRDFIDFISNDTVNDEDKQIDYSYEKYVRYILNKDKEHALNYWERLLEGITEVSEINSGLLMKDEIRKNEPICVSYQFSDSKTKIINDICKKNSLTPSMLLEAVWSIILRTYTSNNDITFGKVVSGRNVDIEGIEDTIGLFINTIPVRVIFDKDMDISKLFQEISKQSVESSDYDFCSLSEVQKSFRGMNLFDTIIVFENYYISNDSQPLLGKIEYSREQTNYGITVSGYLGDRYGIDIMFDSAKYSKAFAEMLLKQIEFVYEQIINNYNIYIDQIVLNKKEEVQTQVEQFNNTYHDFVKLPVIKLFEEQVHKTPDNIALIMGEESLTYHEFDVKANEVANYLLEFGIKNNDIVAVMLDRSIDMMVTIYGILKAGAAYLPIDKNYPANRIEYILKDSVAKLIITDQENNIEYKEIEWVSFENCRMNSKYLVSNVQRKMEDLSYVIYTSGTTGMPKGVMIENHSISNRIQWQQSIYPMSERDRFIQNSSPTFDAAVVEIFGWFLSGSALVLIEPDEEKEPDKLADVIWKNGISSIQFTPSMMNVFLDYIHENNESKKLNSLKYIISGGEILRKEAVSLFNTIKRKNNLTARLLNSYGPTETTVDVLYYECNDIETGDIPIGKPIWNTNAIIVNGKELCGIGQIGELCISGECVARGYINNVELSNEKFVKSVCNDGIMYYTGDLACWLEDGNIAYLGRKDKQVKIRGYRIEVGEIESALNEIEEISTSVVVAYKDERSTCLCAYFIATESIQVRELKEKLSKYLPSYMIPSYFVQVKEIPLTSNGKADINALPKPKIKSKEYIAPSNEKEREIVKVFEKILGYTNIGINNNFYEVGGDSIKAIRIASRLKRRGYLVSVKDIMQKSELQLLCQSIKKVDNNLYEQFQINNTKKISNKVLDIYQVENKEVLKAYPLTPMQKGMLYSNYIDKMDDPYVVQSSYEFNKKINEELLLEALDIVTFKHEVLRSSILCDGVDEPIQVILKNRNFEKQHIVCEGEEKYKIFKEEDLKRGFDLFSDSLMRISLVEIGETKTVLVLTYHHIIMDGWCFSIFMDDLNEYYNKLLMGYNSEELLQIENIDTTYETYIHYLQQMNQEKGLEYWSELLEGYTEHQFIIPENKVLHDKCESNTLNDTIPENELNSIREFCSKENITISTFFETIWGILLSGYNSTNDVVFGKVVSGRNHPIDGIEQCIGLFVNTIPFRVKIEDGASFSELLDNNRNQDIDSMQFDYLPLTDIQKQITNDGALFGTLYAFENYYESEIEKELNFKELETTAGYDYDIALTVYIKDGIQLAIIFNNDKYESIEIQRIFNRMKHIIEQVLENPRMYVDQIELLTDEEKDIIINGFNKTDYLYDNNKTVIKLFEEQVLLHPQNIAVRCNDRVITYEKLNECSNYYAKQLMLSGAKKSDIICIIAKRNIETIISIIAIMKIGAAYLPIEPDLPKARIEYMISDSNAMFALCDSLSYDEYCEFNLENVIEVKMGHYSVDNIECEVNSLDRAYIIYTSGTTGMPKGVEIRHGSLTNLIAWQKDFLNLDSDSIMLQQFAFIFDGSVFEIFPCLTTGGSVEIVDDETKNNPEKFLSMLPGKISIMIPSLLKVLLDVAQRKEMESYIKNMKKIFVGGEELISSLAHQYIELIGDETSKLVNLYGPTEDTVCSTYYEVKEDNKDSISIGIPIYNNKIFIINKDKLCGIGMEGELCISGSSLALGYLNRKELTEERFICNPYCPDERLYKTGDLAKWNENGTIQYLGRIDNQIKLRGFRIELGEIESKLCKIPQITNAVAKIITVNDEKYICAYVVSNKEIDEETIRIQLRESLPEYMIPSYVIGINEIPVTKTGKVDKDKLPLPKTPSNDNLKMAFTEQESILSNIFKKVLNLENVGINQEFLKVGGDSIKAIRIVSKLRSYNYEVNVKDIMREKTIERIALKMKNRNIKRDIDDVGVGESILTPIQKMYLDSDTCKKNHFNQSIFIRMDCKVVEEAFVKTIELLVKQHDVLRSKYNGGVSYIRTVEEFGDINSYIDIVNLEDVTSINNYCSLYQENLNLEQGLLFKVVLFKTNLEDYIFIVANHMVIDGVSWRILLEDFNDIYLKLRNKTIPELPEKTTSFRKWAQMLQNYSQKYSVKKQISYWDKVNREAEKFNSNWSVDLLAENKKEEIELERQFAYHLVNLSGNNINVEINDLLITALARAFKITFGINKIGISMESHGREQLFEDYHVDRTVGWFTSIYPIVITLNTDDIEDNIISVKEYLRKIRNNGIVYGILTQLSGDIENVLPILSFNYLGEFENEQSNYCFELSNIAHGNETATENKFGPPLSINGLLEDQKIKFSLEDMGNIMSAETLEELAMNFKQELANIAQYCSYSSTKRITPYDVGELVWSCNEFDKIAARYGGTSVIERIYPLTPLQEGMLYQKLSNKDDTSYIIQSVFEMSHLVDVDELIKAFEHLSDKYEILRTCFVYEEVCEPRQMILANRTVEVNVIDYSNFTNGEELLKKYSEENIARGFDLANDSLLRVAIIKTGVSKYFIVVCFHHIIMDGWCLPIFINELCNCYDSEQNKRIINNELNGKYEEFVRYTLERDWDGGVEYWKSLLENYQNSNLIYSADYFEKKKGVDIEEATLTKEESKKLNLFAQELGVTVNNIVECALGIVLQQYSNSEDIVFGKVVSGRNVPIDRVEELLGLFINTIPIRIKTQNDDLVRDVIKRIQQQGIESEQYSYCSLADIMRETNHDISEIRVLLAFENYYSEETDDCSKLKLQEVYSREETSFDLSFGVYMAENLGINVTYKTDLYAKKDAELLLRRILSVIKQLIDNSQETINSISICKDDMHMLEKFNDNEHAILDETVIYLFDEVIKNKYDCIAVYDVNRYMTYKEIGEKSIKFARYLQNAGVKKGEVVGVLSERSIDLIIAIYGILRAGAVYMPIGLDWPQERIEYMLKDSGSKIIVAGELGSKITQNLKNIKVIGIEEKMYEKFENEYFDDSNVEGLAYIIYTSGTTGIPKGVMINHKSLSNLVQYMHSNYFKLNNHSIMQRTTYTFDASIWEIFVPFVSGNSMFVLPEGGEKDPEIMIDCIYNNKITSVQMAPSMLFAFLEYAATNNLKDKLRGLHYIFAGGEVLKIEYVNLLKKLKRQYHLDAQLVNLYGPTEATVNTTYYNCVLAEDKRVPIGYPTWNTKIFIINNGKLCGVGIPGELYISGVQLSEGYVNLKSLTDEKFIKGLTEEKVYKSGDIAYWNADGTITCLGRLDDQVKVRGYRIETAEIESVLCGIDEIDNAAVLVKEIDGTETLCAYLVINAEISDPKIEECLLKKIPSYMLPNFFIKVKEFPFTSNGKLDKKALPLPINIQKEKTIIPATTNEEKIVLEAVSVILGNENVNIEDDFFRVGGDSIKAIRLVSYIKKSGYDINVKDIMKSRYLNMIALKLKKVASVHRKFNKDDLLSGYQKDLMNSHLYWKVNMRCKNTIDLENSTSVIGAVCKSHGFSNLEIKNKSSKEMFIYFENEKSASLKISKVDEETIVWMFSCTIFDLKAVQLFFIDFGYAYKLDRASCPIILPESSISSLEWKSSELFNFLLDNKTIKNSWQNQLNVMYSNKIVTKEFKIDIQKARYILDNDDLQEVKDQLVKLICETVRDYAIKNIYFIDSIRNYETDKLNSTIACMDYLREIQANNDATNDKKMLITFWGDISPILEDDYCFSFDMENMPVAYKDYISVAIYINSGELNLVFRSDFNDVGLTDIIYKGIQKSFERCIDEKMDGQNKKFAKIIDFIFSEWNKQAVVKNIQVELEEYHALFIEELTANMIDKLEMHKEYLRDIDMFADLSSLKKAKAYMTNREFWDMCYLQELDQELEIRNIKQAEKLKIEKTYKPIGLQRLYLQCLPDATIQEKVVINSTSNVKNIIQLINEIVDNQGVLRSYYSKTGNKYVISITASEQQESIPFYDLRYCGYKNIEDVEKNIYLSEKWNKEEGELKPLSYLSLARISNNRYILYMDISHSIWDKVSSIIIRRLIDDKITHQSDGYTAQFVKYIEEVSASKWDELVNGYEILETGFNEIMDNVNDIVNFKPFNQSKDYLVEVVNNINRFIEFNKNNYLIRQEMAIVNLSEREFLQYQEMPEEVLKTITYVIAEANGMVQNSEGKVPILLIQEQRKHFESDFQNTLGVFLDYLPIEINFEDCNWSMHREINKMQELQKKLHLNFNDTLSTLCKKNIVENVLSVNYQGIYELDYQEALEILLAKGSQKPSYEIFVNSYAHNLLISYPVTLDGEKKLDAKITESIKNLLL